MSYDPLVAAAERELYGDGDPGPVPDDERLELAPPERAAATVPLTDVVAERVSWLWPGWAPRGKLVVLEGDPAVGKSTVTVAIAAAMSRATRFPDGYEPDDRGITIFSSAEDGLADTLRPRLDAAGGDPEKVFAFTIDAPLDAFPSGLKALEREIVLRAAGLAVIDPIMAHLDPRAVNSHRDQDVRVVLRELAAIAGRTHATILLVRHLNKSVGGQAIYRGGGSIGIGGAARVVILAAADPEMDGQFVLAPVKNNLSAPPKAIAYRIASADNGAGRIEWLGVSELSAAALLAAQVESPGDRSARADATDWLLSFLGDGPRPAKDVQRAADHSGHSWITIRRAAQGLVKKSKSAFGGGWEWSLSSEDAHHHPKMLTPKMGAPSELVEHLRVDASDAPTRCHACRGADFWTSTSGSRVCRTCHPPVAGAESV